MAQLNSRGDINLCHPVARAVFSHLTSRLAKAYDQQEIKTWFRPFETYRSPVRQQELYNQPAANGVAVTKARAWQSAHQYGLAVDFVPLMPKPDERGLSTERQWSWDSSYDWAFIAKVVREEYSDVLHVPLPDWDPGHVEHVMFLDYRTIEKGYDPASGRWTGDGVD